jgi:hypothetical protein
VSNEVKIVVKSDDQSAAGFESSRASSEKLKTSLKSLGEAVAKASLQSREANLKVEKSEKDLAKAVEKYGKESLQARTAAVGLEKAKLSSGAASEELTRAQKAEARALNESSKSASRFKDTLREVGKTAAGVLTADIAMRAADAMRNLVTDSVRQASDLNESLNAVNVTFGSSAKEITDWGKSNAASFGLSQSAFNAMATPLGAMLKNAGLSMQNTTKWTIDLTKRAADMASVFNTSVPEALEAIQAGLRGESDPLERFGVGLSAAKVEAEALIETGKRSASTLTDQEKATARLNIIMKQTSQAQGDFQNTSDGAANAARIASAQFDNAKASLGNSLLPVLAKAATAAASLAEGFNALPAPMQSTVVILGAVGAASVLLGPKIKNAYTEMRNLGTGALATNTKLGAVARGAGKVAGALGAMATASAVLASDAGAKGIDTTRKALEEMRKSGSDSTDALQHIDFDLKNIGQSGRGAGAAIETFTGFIAEGLGRGWEKIDSVNQRMQALDASLAGMVSSGNAKEAADDFELLRQKAEEQGTSVEKLKEFFPQYQNALDAAARENAKTADAAQTLTQTVDQQREAIDKAVDALLGQRDAMRDLEASYDDATEAVKKNGKTLDTGSEEGRANQEALDGIASAAKKAAQATIDQGGSQAEANKIMATARSRFIATARSMGSSSAEAKKLADKLFAIPKSVKTNVNINTGTANARLDALRAKLWSIQGLAMDVNAGTPGHGKGVYKATGGVIGSAATGGARSGLTMVGEHGPELVKLAAGSTVHSNPDTMRILSDLSGQFSKAVDTGTSAALVAAIDRLMEDARKAGDKGAEKIISSYKKRLVDAAKRRDSLDTELKQAISEARRQYVDFVESTKSGIVSGSGGVVGTGSFDSITGQLNRQMQAAKQFASVLSQLKRAGLGKESIAQLIAAGPDEGLAAARTILSSGGAGIRQINSLQSGLAAAGASVGTAGAESMYRKGIVDAEKAYRSSASAAKLDRQVEQLADLLVKAVRKKVSHRATGGVSGGGATVVGEHGPEMVDLSPGSTVYSNPDSARMASASGWPATVVLEVVSSGSRMSDLILEVVRESIRVRGGNVQAVLGMG